MKLLLPLAVLFALLTFTGCATTHQTAHKAQVSKNQSETTYKTASGCIKRKTLWRQFGI